MGRSRRLRGSHAFAHADAPASAGQAPVSWREERKIGPPEQQTLTAAWPMTCRCLGSRSVIVRVGQNPSRAPPASLRDQAALAS